MEPISSFGYWLRRRRKALDLTQGELARLSGCAIGTLKKIETDERLADCLKISVAERADFLKVARAEMPVDRLAAPTPSERPATFPALNILDARRTNLPAQPTPLIGREREITDVTRLLRRTDVRLVTLSGPGGTGKTRLGLQVAAELIDSFADGVYFVDLAPISDPQHVASTIVETLGLKESGSQPPGQQLRAYLRDKTVLLLLDNFEQVLDAALLVADLLAGAPALKVLVTSRAVLHVRGEHEFAVPPLALPDRAHLPPLERLTQYAAVRLFIARAQAAKRNFAVTNATAPAVAEICAQLNGLPLAIELAAARVKLFEPEALLARLGQRLPFLTGGPRDLPLRQRTLRNTIDWSYNLLDSAEQALFRRLGVFVGGCTPEAAEAVCGDWASRAGDWEVTQSPIPNPQSLILDGLAALVDKSLLKQVEGMDGAPRFTMLETIREYALERLETSGEMATLRHQHLAYYLALAEAAEPRLSASDQLVWLDRLAQDYGNLQAALVWAVNHDPEDALRLSAALIDFWLTRGHPGEGRVWLERALACTGAPPHSAAQPGHTTASIAARAKALHGAGMLAVTQGDDVRAEALFAEGLTLTRALGEPRRIARLLNSLAEVLLQQGDAEQAMTLCIEGLALARAADDRSAVAQLLLGLGNAVSVQGDLRSAVSYYEDGLEMYRALEDRRGMAWALHSQGELALDQGDMQRAAEVLAEGLALAREVGDQENTAWLLYYSGLLLLEQHKLAGAAARFGESARLFHVLGAGQGVALNLTSLAAVKIQQQELAQATQLLSVTEAQWQLAASGYGWAADKHAEYDRTIAVVRAHLGDAAFVAAWAEGRAMTLEQAIDEALNY